MVDDTRERRITEARAHQTTSETSDKIGAGRPSQTGPGRILARSPTRAKQEWTQSARRHRIGKARAMHVINHTEPVKVAADDTVGDRLMWIGPDDRGLPLEVIAIVEPDYLLETRARQIARDTLAIAPCGRPSPSAPGRRSPEVKARVPEELRARLQEPLKGSTPAPQT